MKKKKKIIQPTTDDRFTVVFSAWWFFYFLGVIALQLSSSISANLLLNLALAVFVGVPVPEHVPGRTYLNRLRHVVGCVFSLLLLWHESSLPVFSSVWSLIVDPAMHFSSEFILQFFYQAFSWTGLLAVITLLLISSLGALSRARPYYPVVGLLTLLVIGFTNRDLPTTNSTLVYTPPSSAAATVPAASAFPSPTTTDQNSSFNVGEVLSPPPNASPDEKLDFVFQNEATRPTVQFPENISPDFDIILLQICSLGWEDLDVANIDANPFFSQFDYVLTQFNSADSYSHTSAIRLLRGLCGLTDHDNLFNAVPADCYVLDALRKVGYQSSSILNHDGLYSGFTDVLRRQGNMDQPVDNSGLPSTRVGFDGSPVYKDYDALSLWLQKYASSDKPSALFYNSIYLHAGDHEINDTGWWKRKNEINYKTAFTELSGNVTHFFADLKASGRKAVVILVGEHGAALKRTPLQLQTVREIPLPGISIVPAAIKIFGPGFNDRDKGLMFVNNDSLSYQALYTLLARLMATEPYGATTSTLQNALKNLPSSPLVATGDKGVVLQDSSKFLYKNGNAPWEILPNFVTIPKAKLSSDFTSLR